MISLISPSKAQLKIAENIRARRLSMELTQEGLAERSGFLFRRCESLNKKAPFRWNLFKTPNGGWRSRRTHQYS
jgi:transcriptional regulator with XRE-family HTH domain